MRWLLDLASSSLFWPFWFRGGPRHLIHEAVTSAGRTADIATMIRMAPITMEETMAAATVDPMEVGIERPGCK